MEKGNLGEVKITFEGQRCRNCNTPVIKKTHKPNWKPKRSQPYYFDYWFKCLGCGNLYMVESAKRWVGDHKPAQRELTVDEQYKDRMEREP